MFGWFGFSFLLFVGNLLSEYEVYGAGMFNVLSNRTGDVALLVVIAWIIHFGIEVLFIIWNSFQVLLRQN